MSTQKSPQELAINHDHVIQQFTRRQMLEPARFMLDEAASRMLDRLRYIKHNPVAILDAGCGIGHGIEALQRLYPEAEFTGLDNQKSFLEYAERRFSPQATPFKSLKSLISRMGALASRASVATMPTSTPRFVKGDLAATKLNPNAFDFIWSNMALHWHRSPPEVFREWYRLLEVDGLLMFSCFGPSTLIELRTALQRAAWKTQTMAFVDMHDFGDMLMESGFKDPVMDQDIVTLTYKTPQKLLADVRALGGNPSSGRHPGLRGRNALERLYEALEEQRREDGLIHLSLEIINGHAWRGASLHFDGETRIAISSIGRK
ncbi:MAG: methyltransferase domain-containing protein [Alcaligenaceae bacterium]|nr:methyltransferase domain-containing protein [Alcaligenaceae bacterium]